MSISCHEAEPMLAYRLDNELDRAQSQEVEQHLRRCASCRKALQEASHLRAALRQAAAHNLASSALRGRIRLTIERERRSTLQLPGLFPAVIASAILACFVWHAQTAQALDQTAGAYSALGRWGQASASDSGRQVKNPAGPSVATPASNLVLSRSAASRLRLCDDAENNSGLAVMGVSQCTVWMRQNNWLAQRAYMMPACAKSAADAPLRLMLGDIH